MHKQRKARRHETSNHLRKRCLQTLEAGKAQEPKPPGSCTKTYKETIYATFSKKAQYQPKTRGSPEKHNKARHRLQVSARPWLPGCGRGLKAVAGKARRRVQQPPRQHPDLRKWPGVHPGRTETLAPAISSPPLRFRHRGDPARARRSEALNPSREKCHPKLQVARLGLDLSTWPDSPLLRNRSFSPYDPSHGYLAGATEKGLGVRGGRTKHAHTHRQQD